MPIVAQLFFKSAILFLVTGIAIGLQMSISGVHNVTGAHAHFNLLGWVTSAIFGGYYALNPAKAALRIALIHFGVYTAGVVTMAVSLYFLLLGNVALAPLVAVSSLVTLAGVLLFAVVVFGKDLPAPAAQRSAPV